MGSIFDLLTSGRIMRKKAKLLIDIDLDNGEIRKAGDIVYIVIDKGNGKYHAEDNEWTCEVDISEIEFIK